MHQYVEYAVVVSVDKATNQVVVQVPTLDLADYGPTVEEAMASLREMIAFHLEGLLEEGQPIPAGDPEVEGYFIRSSLPIRAA